jgi:hypothetical protein
MKYKVGDVVLIIRERRGYFYRPINGVGIITDSYDMPDIDIIGYKVIVAGKMNETYFVMDRDIIGKVE